MSLLRKRPVAGWVFGTRYGIPAAAHIDAKVPPPGGMTPTRCVSHPEPATILRFAALPSLSWQAPVVEQKCAAKIGIAAQPTTPPVPVDPAMPVAPAAPVVPAAPAGGNWL